MGHGTGVSGRSTVGPELEIFFFFFCLWYLSLSLSFAVLKNRPCMYGRYFCSNT